MSFKLVRPSSSLRPTARTCRKQLWAWITTPRSLSTPSSPPSFPCVDAHAARESRILAAARELSSDPSPGPEPPYARPSPTSYFKYTHSVPLPLTYSTDPLPSFTIAYESWGTLSPAKDNAILLHTGLSASSHAASTPLNPAPGWWEKFIGPGKAIDTDKFFVICTNVLGGCYGSTGPSSPYPATDVETTKGALPRYATRFPLVSIFDMVRAQFHLLDHLAIDHLYASVGSSMGAMQSLAAGWLFPDRVGKVVSISGTGRSSPSAIAMRYAQRSVLMADPNWKNGFYYDDLPPHTGMKLARQIATITYRSGPEWDQRFGRRFRTPSDDGASQKDSPNISLSRRPTLCPDFLIETYLDHQGEQFCLKYDANSLIYISKAMDLFDMSYSTLSDLGLLTDEHKAVVDNVDASEQGEKARGIRDGNSQMSDLAKGLLPLAGVTLPPSSSSSTSPHKSAARAQIPFLILGVQSDILFPIEQQRELASALREAGNDQVRYFELGGIWGHDTFLLDVLNVGGAIRGFLS